MLRFLNRKGFSGLLEGEADNEINMTPLIDMVFILLIFFLVTASFVRESGLDIQRPQAASAEAQSKPGLLVALTDQGAVFIDGRQVELANLRGRVEQYLMENTGGGVMVEADRGSLTGWLVEVVDQCRLAGADNVQVAAQRVGQ
jgi:biopolymer transport protein ExbD